MADGLLNKASIILTPTGYKAGTLYNVAPVVEPYEDFDFARASVASRVNSSGLVEMVGRTLGSELVTCGDFSCADPNDYWNLQNGWSIGDDEAVFSGTVSAYRKLYQTNFITIGKTYQLSFEITSITAGSIANFEPGSPSFDTVGVKTQTFVATYDDLYLEPTNNANLTITNISVKEVIDTNNIPRISYDSNGDNGHILLEPTSTNLVPYSEDFTQGWAVSDATITPNSITSPSGQDNASTLTTSASGGTVQETLTISDGDLTFSLFVRKGTTNGVRLRIDAATDVNGYFNINDGTIFSQTDDAKIEVINADWYRVSISANVTSFVKASIYTTDGTTSYDNGTVYIWGGQLEQLSYATSYIPSLTGSTVTRATETATGAGSADLINSTEGVLYAEIAALANDGTFREISLNDGSTNNVVEIRYKSTANQFQFVVRNGGAAVVSPTITLTNPLEFIKVAFSYKTDDYKMYINGVEVATDTSGTMPSGLNNLSFDWGGSNPFYGKVKALAVFNEALSDDELELLTGVTNYGSFGELASANGYTII